LTRNFPRNSFSARTASSAASRAIVLLKLEQIEPLGAWFANRFAEVVQKEAERLAAGVLVRPLDRQGARERSAARFS
jgi:hypothetical protein